VTKQAVHRPIKELEERGLLSISQDSTDRRVRCLTVTDAGAALEAELTTSQMGLLDAAFSGLGESGPQNWTEVMRRIRAAAEQPPATGERSGSTGEPPGTTEER
jgi:DNA-binding MarR family transcriptional regulator